MFLTTHALAGLVIARYVPNPLALFGLSLAAHFVLDIIPHGDSLLETRYQKNPNDVFVWRVISIDLILLFIVIILSLFGVFRVSIESAMVAILASVIPDFFANLHLYLEKYFREKKLGPKSILQRHTIFHPFLENHYHLHDFIHRLLRTEIRFRYGLLIQAAFIAAFLTIIFRQ